MATKLDARQSVLRSALSMVGSAAGDTLDTILAKIDPELAKLFEDRNILLTDGGTITFTGTQVQFTENLKITLNQKVSGAVPQVISLGSASQNFINNGDMFVAILDRTAGTATVSIVTAGNPLSAANASNQEVFLIAKRVDAADGTQRLYWRNGFAMNAGQTLRLGQGGGSGSGVGGGSDLNSLQFRAQFIESFTEAASNAASAVNGSAGFTNAVYNAAKAMYTVLYDASKTMTTTGTAATLSGTPSFVVAAGDVVVNLVTLEVKKIASISSQTSYTLEGAFATNLASGAVCVSQAVHTKDIYNYAGTGAAISAAFPGSTFSEIMVDYEDNATSGSNLWTPDTTPFAAFTASTDNTNFTTLQVRATNETDIVQSDICPTAGSSLYIRFFSNASSGTGFINLINYEAFMQKAVSQTAGGVLWSAYGTTNNSTTPINCTISVVGGKTTIALTNQYALGANSGQTFGILDVYLNGQLLPRFVSLSVPLTDGYYTEVNSNAIQLDRDYSSVALDLQIILRTQIVDNSSTNTTTITQIQQGQLKNYLINGAYDIWQRGTSLTISSGGASAYLADRWYVKNTLGTSGVITFSQVAGTLVGSKFGASVQITTAPTALQTNGTELYQVIENLNCIEIFGQNISMSASIKALGLVNQVGLQFAYATTETKPSLFFGTEQLVSVNASTFTLGQLIAQNSGVLPTSAGVIGVRIRITGVSSGQLYALNNGFVVEQASVNLGGFANPFYRAGRNLAEELHMCQRYYEKSYDLTTPPGSPSPAADSGFPAGLAANTQEFYGLPIFFKALKRIQAMSVTYWSPVTGTGGVWRNFTSAADVNPGAGSTGQLGQHQFRPRPSSNNMVANNFYGMHWAADAEI